MLIELDLGATENSKRYIRLSSEGVRSNCPFLQCISIPVYDYDVIAYLIQHGRYLRKIAWGITYKLKSAPCDPRLNDVLQHYHWTPRLSNDDTECKKKHAYTVSALTAWQDNDDWETLEHIREI